MNITAYLIGFYFSRCLIGAALGVIPLVLGFTKNNKPLGIIGFVMCIASSAYEPILSVFMAIVFSALILAVKNKRGG